MIVKVIPAVPIESNHSVHCVWLMQITNWVETVIKGILGELAGEWVDLGLSSGLDFQLNILVLCGQHKRSQSGSSEFFVSNCIGDCVLNTGAVQDFVART